MSDQRLPGGGSGTSQSILLVDDDEGVLQVLSRALAESGFAVRTATDGMAALAVLAEDAEAIALVVTDIVMPRLGGLGLHRRIRERGLATPILFTSAYSAVDIQELAQRDPDTRFLPKPWTITELLGAIVELLDD